MCSFRRPLAKVREAYIQSLDQESADEMFAPQVLRVIATDPHRNKTEEMQVIKLYLMESRPAE